MYTKLIGLPLRMLMVVLVAIDSGFAASLRPEPKPMPSKASPAPADKASLANRQADIEKEFRETLTGATLEGTWQMTGEGGLTSTAPLTEAKPERYTIAMVEKGLEDNWVVSARIEFADKDVTVPVPVRVVWAGDTAVITVDEIPIPLVGTYSARVMIHKGFYSGIWYSTNRNYGGVMSGRIGHSTKDSPGAPTKERGDGK